MAKIIRLSSRSNLNDRDHLLKLKYLKSRKVDGTIVWLSRTDHVVLPTPAMKVPDFIDLTTLDPEFSDTILNDYDAK